MVGVRVAGAAVWVGVPKPLGPGVGVCVVSSVGRVPPVGPPLGVEPSPDGVAEGDGEGLAFGGANFGVTRGAVSSSEPIS